jgi:hypothetical protein
MAYPATIDSLTNPSGTQTLASPDHALQHSNANDAIEAIEAVIGTTAGTSIAKNFTAGQFAARTTGETFTNTTISSGTINNVIFGTPRATGGTVSGAMLGTNTITGGTITTILMSGGTINSTTLGTPVISHITTAATTTPHSFLRAVVPIVGTIADAPSGTITANASSQQIVEVTFGTHAVNRTIGTPTNPSDGQFLGFRIKNNATSTGTLVWASVFRFASGTAGTIVMGTTASSWTYAGFRYNQTDVKWDDLGQNKNIV